MNQNEENARFAIGCGCVMLLGAVFWCVLVYASYHVGAWVLG